MVKNDDSCVPQTDTESSDDSEDSKRTTDAAAPAKGHSSPSRHHMMRLFEEYRRTKDPCVKERIVSEYMNLASAYAWKYSGRGVDYEDLRQEGYLGLLRAIEGFDPSRGVQFQTYATYFVEGYIRQYFRDKTWACRVPRSVKSMALQVKELTDKLGRTPTKQEVVSMSDIPESKVDDALAAARMWNMVSFYRGDPNPSSSLSPAVEASYIDEELERVPLRIDIQKASERALNKVEATVIKMYYEDDLSQREIARKLGTYQMMVSRSLQRSAGKLGQALSEEGRMAG